MSKPILCVDFDGVIANFDNGWQGPTIINEGPVPGALEWLAEMTKHFRVCIYSSRTKQPGGLAAMRQALYKWVQEETDMTPPWLSEIEFPRDKPPAFLTIDDRAICFEGNFDDLRAERLLGFTPWNKMPRHMEEGYQAYKDGRDLEDNPYDPGSSAYGQWDMGWAEARDNDEPRRVKTPNPDEGEQDNPADQETLTPNEEGARAYDEGKLLKECPYDGDSDEAAEWEGGWMEAQESDGDRNGIPGA